MMKDWQVKCLNPFKRRWAIVDEKDQVIYTFTGTSGEGVSAKDRAVAFLRYEQSDDDYGFS